jgi:phosphoglucosamine mutase
MARELFGTDGIRGIPGQYPLDDHTLYWAGRSLARYLRRQNSSLQVLIGMDTRESGPHIAGQIAAGLREEGAAPISAGIISTPGVACLVRKHKFGAGVVVSASHNPYHDNGVKLFAGSGMKFLDEIEEHIEADILRNRESKTLATALPLEADRKLDEEYLDFLRGCVLPGADFVGLKIVVDCANGAASSLAPDLFSSLGATVVAIHNCPDGRNINAGCGSLHPEGLSHKVVEQGAALGVAFDGDADRAMFISSSGRLIDGDGVLLMLARYLRSTGKLKGAGVIGTTMANLGLERLLAADSLKLARTPVGDRYVLEEMLRTGSNLGGEQSGHIIFLDDATTGDGLLTAVKVASLVALHGSLDALVADLKVYPQTIINVNVRSKPPLEEIPCVSDALRQANLALGDSGRIVLRYSGTEPKARVMVEAERAEDVSLWAETIAAAVRSAVGA